MSEKGFNIFDDMEDIVVNENDDQVLASEEEPIDLLADDTMEETKEDSLDLLAEETHNYVATET